MTLGLLAGYYRGRDRRAWSCAASTSSSPSRSSCSRSAIVALLGPSLRNIIIVFAVTTWPVYARIVRGVVLALRAQEFVQAARGSRAPDRRILCAPRRPERGSPVLVIASFEIARMIILEAALGFLGLGVPPPTPTWGGMLADGRDTCRDAWWLAAFPGPRHHAHVAGLNLLGDGLRDILDPTLRNVEG